MAVNFSVSLTLTGAAWKSAGVGGAPASERTVAPSSHGTPGVSLPLAQAPRIRNATARAQRQLTAPSARASAWNFESALRNCSLQSAIARRRFYLAGRRRAWSIARTDRGRIARGEQSKVAALVHRITEVITSNR